MACNTQTGTAPAGVAGRRALRKRHLLGLDFSARRRQMIRSGFNSALPPPARTAAGKDARRLDAAQVGQHSMAGSEAGSEFSCAAQSTASGAAAVRAGCVAELKRTDDGADAMVCSNSLGLRQELRCPFSLLRLPPIRLKRPLRGAGGSDRSVWLSSASAAVRAPRTYEGSPDATRRDVHVRRRQP